MIGGPLSGTAVNIALKTFALTRTDPCGNLFDPWTADYYERLIRCLPAPGRYFHPLLKWSPGRNMLIALNEMLLPGDMMHVLLRKKLITEWVGEMVRQDDCQLLVPGAGLDHLSARWSPQIPCIETDLQQMASFKKQWLQNEGYANPNLEVLTVRSPQQPTRELLESGSLLSWDKKTVVIAEGLFAYMDQQQVRAMLEVFSAIRNRVTLICTLFSLEEMTALRRTIYRSAVRLTGEPLRLRQNLSAFRQLLKEAGFRVTRSRSAESLQREILHQPGISRPVLDGFHLMIATR